MKKISICILIISIFLLSTPQKTRAQYVVLDPAVQTKDWGLDGLAYQASAVLLKRLTAKTVNWINNGFKGNPGYIQNPKQFFLDIGDETASRFLSQAGVNQICTPFRAQVRLALVKNYIDDNQNYSCSLSILRNNFDAFTRDFTQGGWEGWFEVTQNPQNNPYGTYLEARNKLAIQVGQEQNQFKEELNLSSGFLNFKRCPAGGSYTDTRGTFCSVEEETVTPGILINDQLSKSLGSSWERLNAADEFNEIVTALITQLIEQLAGKAGGLFGASERNPQSGRTYTDDLRDEAQPLTNYPISATSGSINCRSTGGTAGTGVDTDGDGIIDTYTGGSGGTSGCSSTPGSIRGLPAWPLGGGNDGGGHSCPAYTPDPNVDCTSVRSGDVLAILNRFPASNRGITDAEIALRSAGYNVTLLYHPIRLDKFDFGNGLIVDVMVGAVGTAGPNGIDSIAEGGWGWLPECSCNRDPAGHAGTPINPPIQINTTYSVTFTISGFGDVTETTSAGTVSFTSTSSVPTIITRTYPKDTNVSVTATPAIGSTFVGWGGACLPFGTQQTCAGNVSGNGAVSITFSP